MLDFDPVYSTPREDAAQFLVERYPPAAPVDCRMLNRGFNDVYLVVAPTGERTVFRLSHHRARGAPDVTTETAFLAHLDRAHVPVAAPVPALRLASLCPWPVAGGLARGGPLSRPRRPRARPGFDGGRPRQWRHPRQDA